MNLEETEKIQDQNGSSDTSFVDNQVVAIIARVAGIEESLVDIDSDLVNDIGIDSLGFYEILIEADEKLGIRIPEADLLGFKTVRDVQDYLRRII